MDKKGICGDCEIQGYVYVCEYIYIYTYIFIKRVRERAEHKWLPPMNPTSVQVTGLLDDPLP